MATKYVQRKSALQGEDQKPNANTFYVDSDTNTVKVGTGASGTSENELQDLATAQTVTGAKTMTSPLFATSFIFSESTANLTVTASDQTAAGTVNFPDVNAVGGGVLVSAVMKFDASAHSAAGASTGTVELAAASFLNNIQIISTVVWNSGTSDVLDVGDDEAATGWFSQVDISNAAELVLGEVLDISNAENWGTAQGAYLVAATGVKGQATAAISGVYYTAASEVIGVLTGVGTAPTTGTTFMNVTWSVPTETAATFVAT